MNMMSSIAERISKPELPQQPAGTETADLATAVQNSLANALAAGSLTACIPLALAIGKMVKGWLAGENVY